MPNPLVTFSAKLPTAVAQGAAHMAQAFGYTAATVMVAQISQDIRLHQAVILKDLMDAAAAGGAVAALSAFTAFLAPSPSQNVSAPVQTTTTTTTVPTVNSVTTTQVTVHDDPAAG